MPSAINTQPMLCWRADLSATRTADTDGSCFHVEDPQRRKFFRVGFAEYTLLSQFDGRRSLPEVAESANRALGTDSFSEADVLAVIQWVLQNGLLKMASVSEAQANGAALALTSWHKFCSVIGWQSSLCWTATAIVCCS